MRTQVILVLKGSNCPTQGLSLDSEKGGNIEGKEEGEKKKVRDSLSETPIT